MNKGLAIGLVVAAFFVGAFVDRHMMAPHAREASALHEANSGLARAQAFIAELRAPLKARPMRTPLSDEAVEAFRVKLESGASTYLIYRTAATLPSEGNFETAVPIAMLRQEADGLCVYLNFKSRQEPGKEIRLRMQDEK